MTNLTEDQKIIIKAIVPISRQDEARRFMAAAYAERTGGRSILIK